MTPNIIILRDPRAEFFRFVTVVFLNAWFSISDPRADISSETLNLFFPFLSVGKLTREEIGAVLNVETWHSAGNPEIWYSLLCNPWNPNAKIRLSRARRQIYLSDNFEARFC